MFIEFRTLTNWLARQRHSLFFRIVQLECLAHVLKMIWRIGLENQILLFAEEISQLKFSQMQTVGNRFAVRQIELSQYLWRDFLKCCQVVGLDRSDGQPLPQDALHAISVEAVAENGRQTVS